MARQLRIEFGGGFYHVTSRGNLRDDIFFDDKDRERFLEIRLKTKERYSYLFHAERETLMGRMYLLDFENNHRALNSSIVMPAWFINLRSRPGPSSLC